MHKDDEKMATSRICVKMSSTVHNEMPLEFSAWLILEQHLSDKINVVFYNKNIIKVANVCFAV